MEPDQRKAIRRDYFFKGTVVFTVVAACLLFAFVVFNYALVWRHVSSVLDVLKPVFYGIVIAYLVNPIVNLLDSFFSGRRRKIGKTPKAIHIISVLLALLIFLLVIALCFYLIIPQFIGCIGDLIEKLPDQAKSVTEHIVSTLRSKSKLSHFTENFFKTTENWVEDKFVPHLSSWVTGFSWASDVANGIGAVFGFIKNVLIGLVCALYLLIQKDRFLKQSRKLIYALFRKSLAKKLLLVAKKSHKIFSGFINGKLLDSLIIGVLCFIGVWILRIPYAMLVSVVVGITNVIPVFGPYLGGIPCVILVLLANPIKGITLGVFIILLQTLDGNFIGPKILGNKTGIETFWVVFSITVGGGLFGVFGMLIGVPAFAVCYYLLRSLANLLLNKKGLPVGSDYYTEDVCQKIDNPATDPAPVSPETVAVASSPAETVAEGEGL